jgi:hypothetical protein
MSVFLRWGIFGIIGFAALMYAYNASKRMAERHSREPAAVVSDRGGTAGTTSREPATEPVSEAASEPGPAPVSTAAPHCEAEVVVAQRALDARREGMPLDRLLRIQEIAWQEPVARRLRLEEVATRWYRHEGDEPVPEALRIYVISDCVHFSPAP